MRSFPFGNYVPVLDGGRTANLKFEQTGVKFATPTVNKINAFGEEDDVAGRMLMIERLGGILKYNDVADKVFRSNLCMIDLHFPRMLGEMLRVMHLDGISKVSDLTEAIKQINPLKIKDELIHKHSYYEYKMKQFLMALALGMRPAKIFNGIDSAISGFLFVMVMERYFVIRRLTVRYLPISCLLIPGLRKVLLKKINTDIWNVRTESIILS